jgi:hypothetical protein
MQATTNGNCFFSIRLFIWNISSDNNAQWPIIWRLYTAQTILARNSKRFIVLNFHHLSDLLLFLRIISSWFYIDISFDDIEFTRFDQYNFVAYFTLSYECLTTYVSFGIKYVLKFSKSCSRPSLEEGQVLKKFNKLV